VYEATITRKGKELLSGIGDSSLVIPQRPEVRYLQRDNKFLCGACGSALDQHSEDQKAKAWMCAACGQVYVQGCLDELRRMGGRTTCTGSNCSAARRKVPLSTVLRKIGSW
jgi:ribosomal protein L37AE/L43A